MANRQLNDLAVTIAGKLRGLFAWPTVMVGMNGNTPVPLQAAADGTLAVSTESVAAVTQAFNQTDYVASKILKAAAGSLVSLMVFNFNAAQQFILVMDSATLPSDGNVTLIVPPIPVAGASVLQIEFTVPVVAANGITVCNSSTAISAGKNFKTIGAADCSIFGQVI